MVIVTTHFSVLSISNMLPLLGQMLKNVSHFPQICQNTDQSSVYIGVQMFTGRISMISTAKEILSGLLKSLI